MTRAYVRDLRAIIEQDLREANKCNDLYDLTMLDRNGEETISTFTAVYCEIGLNQPVNNFIETHFLTTSTCLLCSRIANQLAYLAWAAETVYLSKYIVYRDKDGKIGVYRETPRTISSDGVFAPFRAILVFFSKIILFLCVAICLIRRNVVHLQIQTNY